MAGSPEFLGNLGARFGGAVVRRVIGIVALLLVAGAVAGVKMLMHPASETAATSTVMHASADTGPLRHANTHPVAAAAAAEAAKANADANGANVANNVNVANNANSVPANAGTKTALASNKKAGPGRVSALASTDGTGAPVVTAVPQTAPASNAPGAHLDEHLTYQYNALGRRDPFQSLVDGQFVGNDLGGDAPPDPGGIKVVGIVWGATDQFALVEDVRGNSFVLRRGDKVQNGYVENLKRDGVVVSITADGQSQSVVIPLTRKGDSNAH